MHEPDDNAAAPGPTRGAYWTLVDISSSGYTETYEHRLPHGMLVRVRTTTRNGPPGTWTESLVFVPNPPSLEPYR